MLYNPVRVPEGTDILSFFKELKKYRPFTLSPGETISNTMVMMYIFCMYDAKSPYRKKYPDALKRKVEIAHDIGWKVDDQGHFESPVADFLEGKNQIVNLKAVEYIRMHRSSKYALLVSMESSYYKILLDIMNGDTRAIQQARTVQADLEQMQLEIQNEDKNPFLSDSLLRYIEQERIELRPEDIAQKMREGKTPVSMPDHD